MPDSVLEHDFARDCFIIINLVFFLYNKFLQLVVEPRAGGNWWVFALLFNNVLQITFML